MLIIQEIIKGNVSSKQSIANSSIYGWKQIMILYTGVSLLRLLFVLQGVIDLDPEEAQYWLWSKYPDWSYYSKPPLIAIINGITSAVVGDHAWSVRMNAIIFASFIGLAIYYIANKLYNSEKMAFFISASLLLLPAYHYISIFFTTDVLVSLFWLLTSFFFWMAIKQNTIKYWILTGITIGIGTMAKYALLFFIPFSFLYLLLKKSYLLRQKGYYISLVIAAIIFSPILAWNINHNMVGIFHITNLAGYGNKIGNLSNSISYELEFIGGQLLLNFPFLLLLFFWRKYKIGTYLKGEFEQYIIYKVSFIFIIFIGVSLVKKVHINWLIFSYFPLYIILLKAIWESEIIQNKFSKIYLVFSTLLLLLLLLLPVFEIKISALPKIIPVKMNPYIKLIGWENLVQYVNDEMETETNGKEYVILSDKYQIASQFSFYSPGKPKTYCLPYSGRRMNQFDIWGIPKDDTKDKLVVFVRDSPLESNKEINALIDKNSIDYFTSYPVLYKGEKVRTYYIYLLSKMPDIKSYKEVITKY